MNRLVAIGAMLALATACGSKETPSSGSSSGSSGSTGSSGSSGTAGDVKVDGGTPDANAGHPLILPGHITMPGEPPVMFASSECAASTDGGPVIDGCMTAELHCGDVVKGNTRGGVKKVDTRFYEKNFCTPATTKHDDGDERIYKLVVPDPQTRVIAYLDTPCANLDLAAWHDDNGSTCPTLEGDATPCEMSVKKGSRKFVDIRDNVPRTYWLVVEGQGADVDGGFSLSIQCEKW